MKLWRAEAAERNEIGLCLISISLKVKVSIDKKLFLCRFCIVWENDISQWTDQGFNTPMRQKRSRSGSLVLVTGLEIISGESPDTMTGQIQFSSVTYCFCTFVILFFFHSNYPFFCVFFPSFFCFFFLIGFRRNEYVIKYFQSAPGLTYT